MRSVLRSRSAGLFIVAVVCTTAHAQSGVIKRFNFGNQDYGFFVTGTNTDGTSILVEQQKLSGTNVTINVHVGSGWVPAGSSGSPNVTDATLTNVEVYILGGSTPDDTLPSDTSGPGAATASVGNYRLATTYFNHNTSINVRVKCTFTFTHDLHQGQTQTVVNFDEYLQFKAYNYLSRVGTAVDSQGNDEGEAAELFAQVSYDILMQTENWLNHTVDPASVNTALSLGKSTLLAMIKPGTVFVSAAHGNLTQLYDSFAYGNPPDTNHAINAIAGGSPPDASAVNGQVARKKVDDNNDSLSPVDWIPEYNLLVFYTCMTLNAGPPLPGSYLTTGFGIAGVDRAHAGYTKSVNNFAWDHEYGGHNPLNPKYLHEHATLLFSKLAQGKTLKEARNETELFWQAIEVPATSGARLTPIAMQIVGDDHLRMKYVNFSPAETAYAEANSINRNVNLIKLPIIPN